MQNEQEQSHPSYGLISIGRRSGSAELFGSELKHQHFMYLRLEEAVLKRSYYEDKVYPQKIIAEVELSEIQFAQLICSPNTTGVPCTIRYANGQYVERAERGEGGRQKFDREVQEKLSDLIAKVERLSQSAKELETKKSVTKAEVKNLSHQIGGLVTEIKSNLPFIGEMFQEWVEGNVAKAKAEFEAYVNLSLQQKGLSVAQDQLPKMLEGEPETST